VEQNESNPTHFKHLAGVPQIVFVGKSKELFKEVQSILSLPDQPRWYKTSSEALDSLTSADPSLEPPDSILIDTISIEDAASVIQKFRDADCMDNVPIISLIDAFEQRDEFLNAGSDEYIVLPLIPTEVRTRVAASVKLESLFLDVLCDWMFERDNSSEEQFNRSFSKLAKTFSASGAWVFIRESEVDQFRVLAHSVLDDEPEEASDRIELQESWGKILQEIDIVQVTTITVPSKIEIRTGKDTFIRYLLSVPLINEKTCVGALMLGYVEEPFLSSLQKHMLALVGTQIVNYLEVQNQRQQSEIHSLQTNLMGLITRIIDQDTDLKSLLALTLEHTVLPLGASIGCIWMIAPDGESLELASSLSPSPVKKIAERLRVGQGLIGWVADQRIPLLTNNPTQHPHYDPKLDVVCPKAGTMLAIPLSRNEENLGVLCLYWDRKNAVSDEELIIIESIAELTAAYAGSRNLIEQLSDYSKQQHALLEMSQQIANGLDLETTLNRGLQWVTRLIDVEYSMLWLIHHEEGVCKLAAAMGSGFKNQRKVEIPFDDEIFGEWINLREPVIVNDPMHNPPYDFDYEGMFGVKPRNLIVLPMAYRGEVIGLLQLMNRVGGLTLENEPAVLSTAADMVAISVGNARLHAQTLDLIQERERAHAMAFQAARLATVGRLTASLSHEINNPMQAIRGALALAKEDLRDEESLQDYIMMCIQESDRVVDLVNKMRHVYNPASDSSGTIQINKTIRDMSTFANRVSIRQGVDLHMELEPRIPEIHGAADQMQLVFLSMTLCLSDAIAAIGGGDITIRSYVIQQGVCVEFVTDTLLPAIIDLFDSGEDNQLTESALSLTFSRDIIHAMGGSLQLSSSDEHVIVSIELPLLMERVKDSSDLERV
jgi:GAF domain-containing protein